MHRVVTAIVAMSIRRITSIPNQAMRRPASAGETRYWEAEANCTSPPARAYCRGVSRSVTVAR